MVKRLFRLIYFYAKDLICIIILLGVVSCSPSSGTRPNVVLILADDLGWSDIGCYGGEVNTPNLDQLASGGVRFSQMYNAAKCFPSRACLLTGLYAQQTGYHDDYRLNMDHALTLGELFKEAGYRTLFAGKHHSTELPVNRGFDHYSGLLDGASNHFNPGKRREGEGQPAQKRTDRKWVIDGQVYQPYTPEKGFYSTDAFTDYALGWLEAADDNDPFFLYLAYTAPHDPLMAWDEDIEKYEGKYDHGYSSVRAARIMKQRKLGLLSPGQMPAEPTSRQWSELTDDEKADEIRKMEVYAAMIDRMDQNIGKLLAKLDEMKVRQNTLILFLSDNGASAEVVRNLPGSGEIGSLTRWTSLGADWANVSNTPFRYYKNYSHEGGIRSPFIVNWPDQIEPRQEIIKTPLHFIDILPTFADLLRVEYPTAYNERAVIPVDGISFLPLLYGGEVKRNRPLYWQWRKGAAIREENWKLVKFGKEWELYDLASDPVESQNLAAQNPAKYEELKEKYENWFREFED